ncbi:MAG: hypothetical protein KUG78_01330 [Kangiellaceae bacterium]|nr:hypothetical protein [Kangiellaceae bacterium]
MENLSQSEIPEWLLWLITLIICLVAIYLAARSKPRKKSAYQKKLFERHQQRQDNNTWKE